MPELPDIQAYFTVLIVLGTWPYLLFFCRAFKLLGPFVLLVSRVILSDLVKFGIIYLLFVLGFSQSFYIIFTSHNGNHMQDPKCRPKNPLGNISESIMNTILMSLNDFDRIACHFDQTSHPSLSTIMFLLYMPVSAVLLINLFIAMIGLPRSVPGTRITDLYIPGKAYSFIALSSSEWVRQWARVVLLVERGVRPGARAKAAQR